jgi:initiation factor 1A
LEEAKKTGVSIQDEERFVDEARQYEEDELLALYLQREERSKVKRVQQPSALKRLTPLEYKLINEQIGVEEDEEEEPEETEYNYVEPFEIDPDQNPKQEYPLLYDDAQKKEDKEIGHVEKRMVEKRVNAAPMAMHHKPYATRNKGKVLVYGANRVRPTPKSYTFPVRSNEYDYGYVTKVLGGCRFLVFCYSTGRVKLCRMAGKLKYSRVCVYRGEVVLFKVRSYQDKKADIVYRYTDEEYNTLLEIGELTERDPKKILPQDVWKKIVSYLDPETVKNLNELYNNQLFKD